MATSNGHKDINFLSHRYRQGYYYRYRYRYRYRYMYMCTVFIDTVKSTLLSKQFGVPSVQARVARRAEPRHLGDEPHDCRGKPHRATRSARKSRSRGAGQGGPAVTLDVAVREVSRSVPALINGGCLW